MSICRFRVVVVDLRSFYCTEKAEQVVVISFVVPVPQRPSSVVTLTYIHAHHQKIRMSITSYAQRSTVATMKNAKTQCVFSGDNVEGMSDKH